MHLPTFIALSAVFLAAGCNRGSDLDDGLAVLGNRTHSLGERMEVIGDDGDGLNRVSDLAFNPSVPGELWVVNKADDSVSIFNEVGTPDQSSEHLVDSFAQHFMEKVTSIAFGETGHFATCQDGRNTYNGATSGNNFTGPTLWSSDREVFSFPNPDAVQFLGGTDLGSHLDMLHESPECMGIAWESESYYWVFDGFNNDLVRYGFQHDHGPGFDDHCDGDIQRWEVGVRRVQGVVSHLAFDRDSGLLYVADTGNGRIGVLDTTVGSRGRNLASIEDGACGGDGPDHYTWEGGALTELVTGLDNPAGIALANGILWVTENGTGVIRAYDLNGVEIDHADTGLGGGALQGIYAVSADELWFVDSNNDRLYRVKSE